MTPQHLKSAMISALLSGRCLTLHGKQIADARLSMNKNFLVVYYGPRNFKLSFKSDGGACSDGVWPETAEWASLESQVQA